MTSKGLFGDTLFWSFVGFVERVNMCCSDGLIQDQSQDGECFACAPQILNRAVGTSLRGRYLSRLSESDPIYRGEPRIELEL